MRGGGTGQCSPSASSALTKNVLYSSSAYTVFYSVIYNSVVRAQNRAAKGSTLLYEDESLGPSGYVISMRDRLDLYAEIQNIFGPVY